MTQVKQRGPLEHLRRSVDRMAAADLAERWGTPLYVTDLLDVDLTVANLVEVLGDAQPDLLYSLKANPSPPLVRRLAEHGVAFDACSAFDLRLLERLGLLDERTSFCTHSLGKEDLAAIIHSRVHVVADSGSQIRRLVDAGHSAPIGLRVNVGVTAGFHPHVHAAASSSRFGVGLNDVLSVCVGAPLAVRGLHCHIGSDVADPSHHLAAAAILIDLAAQLPEVRYLNLGGGLPVAFTDDESYDLRALGVGLADLLQRFRASTGRTLQLRLEPGGHLSRSSGTMLTRVNEVRHLDERQIVMTDASTNTIPGAILYDAVHPVVVVGSDSSDLRPSSVAGNLMQPGDLIRRDLLLPAVSPGDLLAIGLVGAYCAVRGTTFNGRPLPTEVAFMGTDRVEELVRPRLTSDELIDAQFVDVPRLTAEDEDP